MKFKSKLVKRLVIIAAVFFVLVGGAGGAYLYRKAVIRAEMERARVEGLKAFADGDKQRAVDLLGKYIGRTKKPADDAMIAYAKTRPLLPLPQNDHMRQAIFVLRTLLRDKSAAELAQMAEQRRQLLNLYVKMQFWVEGKTLAEELRPDDAHIRPEDASVFAALAKTNYALGNLDKSSENAWKWIALEPRNLEGQLMVLELARRTGNYKVPSNKDDNSASTTDLVERLIAASYAGQPATVPSTQPSQLDARDALLRGYALFLYADPDERSQRSHRFLAGRQLHAAVDFAFPDPTLTEMFIGVLDQLHRVDDSMAVLRRLEKDASDPAAHAAVRARLARRLWELEDHKSVVALLADLELDKPATSSELMGLDALSELALGNRARAEAIQKALGARDSAARSASSGDAPAAAWAELVRTELFPKSAAPAQLAALCEKAITVEKSPYLAFILGNLKAGQKDPDGALRSWKSSAQWSVTWARPLVYMAPLLSQTGQHPAAVAAALEGTLRAPNSVPAALTYFTVLDAAVDAGLVADPKTELASIDANFNLALRAFDALLCLRVNLMAAGGSTADATKLVRTRFASDAPLPEQTLSRLLAISQKGRLADVETMCRVRLEKDFSHSPRIAAAQAAKLIAAGKPAEAVQSFEKVRAGATDPQSVEWRLAWAQCLDRASDPRAAQAVIQLADAEPRDLNVQLFAGEARSTSPDRDFLNRVLKNVHDLAGEGTAWRLLSARNMLRFATGPQDPQIKKAAEMLQQVLTSSPSSLEARLLMTDAQERGGHASEALTQIKNAVTERPDSPDLVLHYARLLHRQRDDDTARDQLTRLAKLPGLSAQNRTGAAALATEMGDMSLALSLLGDFTPATPAENLLVAQVNWMNNRLLQAQAAYQAIVDSPDAEPEAVESAAEFFASRSEPAKVTALLDRLAADKRYTARARYQLGHYLQRQYGPAKAIEHYNLAVAADPSLAGAWRELIAAQLDLGQTAAAADSVRQGTAKAPGDSHLAALNVHPDWFRLSDSAPDLRQLLRDYVQGPDADPAWLQEIIDIYKSRTGTDDLTARLIQTTDSLIARYPQVQPLYNFAMDLRFSMGLWPDVSEWASRAAAAFPGSLQPQVMLVRILTLQKKWPQVLSESQKWRLKSGAFQLPADLSIANAYVRLGRGRDAANQLEPYLSDPEHLRDVYLTVLPAYAAAVRKAGTADVSNLMEPLLKADAARRANYMNFVVGELKDDPSAAAAWLDHAAQAIPAGATAEQITLADAWRKLFKATSGHPEFLTKAVAILGPLAGAKDPDNGALLQLAVVQEDLDPKAAEASYRRVLAAAANGSYIQRFARNNLAYLLAQAGTNLDEAAQLCTLAVNAQPKIAAISDTMAFVETKRRRYDDALTYARDALKAEPRKVQFIVRVADLQLKRKNPAQAQKTLDAIRDLEIDTADESDDVKKQLQVVCEAVKQAPSATASPQ